MESDWCYYSDVDVNSYDDADEKVEETHRSASVYLNPTTPSMSSSDTSSDDVICIPVMAGMWYLQSV